MTTSEDATPALRTAESIDDPGTASTADATPPLAEPAADAADALSPAVRRLVRQYDLDITGIHGTGPDGRIRVGDVIGMLGPRAEQAVRGTVAPRAAGATQGAVAAPASLAEEPASEAHALHPVAAATITTVFECDLGRVLAHRKRLRAEDVELLLTSYFLAAFVDALTAVPEITWDDPPCIGVELTTADGDVRTLKLESADAVPPLAERARAIDAELRRNLGANLAGTNLLVHHYGASGSLIATPTPLGPGHAASLGIGRVRREIVLRNVDGDETPRVTTRCHLSLSFLPDHVALHRANQFLAHAVRLLEQWPD